MIKFKQSYLTQQLKTGNPVYARLPVSAPTKPVLDQPLTPKGLVDAKGKELILGKDQYSVLEHFNEGKHLVVIGAAGTGKTTVVQALALLYHQDNPDAVTQYRIRGQREYAQAPKFAVCAFTNRATNNIKMKLTVHGVLGQVFGANVTTCHNLLEYTVEFVIDEETGNYKRHYYPQKDENSILDIDYLVLEEATTVGVGYKSLWNELYAALPPTCKIIMLGDINQLPPVIGKPVLSYAIQSPLFQLCELTTIHRQALDNPIIRQAHRCLAGKMIETDLNGDNGVQIFSGKTKIKVPFAKFEKEAVMKVLSHFMENGKYNPYEDMVLSPYNKISDNAVSAQGIAKLIASKLAYEQEKKVYEIQAGFQTVYLAIGDRVFYEKEDGIVTNITTNASYSGRVPREPSYNIDHFGNPRRAKSEHAEEDFLNDDVDYDVDLDRLLEGKEERKNTASHTVEITYSDGTVLSCSSVGEYAELQLGYALSIYKSQGSEWSNVFVVLHDSNNTMLFREMLYTAMTRPRKFLGVISQEHTIKKTISKQRLKGNSLHAKIEFLNSGYLDQKVELDPSRKYNND